MNNHECPPSSRTLFGARFAVSSRVLRGYESMKTLFVILIIALMGCGKSAQPKMASDFMELNGATLAAAVGRFGEPSADGTIDPVVYRADKGPPGGLARRYTAAGGTAKIRVLQWKQGEYYTAVWFAQTNGDWLGFGGYKAHQRARW
jgi:hypothetical protein